MQKLLFVDTSYNFNEIKKRNSLNVILSRDLDSFFERVISVHPVANLTNKKLFLDNSFYKKNIINNNHIFYEFSSGKKTFFIFEYFSFFFNQIRMIIYLSSLIKKENINFIKSGDINYAGLISFILSKITGIKYYVRVGSNNDKIREVIKKPLQPKLFKKIIIEKYFEKLILKNCSHVFPANYDNAKFVNSYLPKSNKITVIRYGQLIHDSHYLPRDRREILNHDLLKIKKNKKLIITCIARFEKVKKVDHVIEVFSKLLKNNNKLVLVLVGDGSCKNQYIKIVNNLKISNDVYFVGEKDQNWISQLLSFTDLVLSPHTGRALCEAALAGCKIVGYDIDWQSEIIEHNSNGFLANFEDKDKLFFYSEKILNNVSKYEYFAINIREKALKILNKKKNISEEINIIAKLLK